MQLKQEANNDARKRFHLLRRLRRAVVHSNNLLQLCEKCKRCDTRTKLEAQAYAAWMLGNVEFEQQQWKEAFENFGNAQYVVHLSVSLFYKNHIFNFLMWELFILCTSHFIGCSPSSFK